jgi:hypothetical protein
MEKIITVFGSSRPVEGDAEYRDAFEIGLELGKAGFVVCNGGYGGIMSASARGAKEAGGTTIGVTTGQFPKPANRWIDREIRVPKLTDRLMKLIELGDGYVVLKGGTGTLLELAAVWEFINKGLLREKPIVAFGDFWNGVIETLKNEQLWEGSGDCARYILRTATAEECAAIFKDRFR